MSARTGTPVQVSVVVAIDEEEAELVGLVRDITEGWLNAVHGAKGDPVPEGVGLGSRGLGGVGSGGDLERRAERSLEASSGGRVTKVQGRGCG